VFQCGDLVKIKDNTAISSLAGSTGIIIRNLGTDATHIVTGENEQDSFYYEVNVTAQGNQILLDRELTLLRKA